MRLLTKLQAVAVLSLIFILFAGLSLDNRSSLIWSIFTGPTNNLKISLDGIAVPNTNPKSQPDFDIFAWNSFIALNWPAVEPDASNGYQRGIPDVTKSFKNAKSNDLLVWETFKEKREIFNQVDTVTGDPYLAPWNSAVDYGPLRAADTDIDETAVSSVSRTFHQGSKQIFNSFDETAEVGSEALEATYPDGSPNPIFQRPVGPRVWKGVPSDSVPVVYEVKLNYDYYNYINANNIYKLESSEESGPIADTVGFRLPYRTSAATGPKGQTERANDYAIATNYDTSTTASFYRNLVLDGSKNPPLIGSMQFKAGWIELDPTSADTAQYHTADALFYDTNMDGVVEPQHGLFGLIGLHIIQRVHLTNNENEADPSGGTFIFATWEHTSIRENATTGYTYSNYYNPNVDPAPVIIDGDTLPQGFYPPIDRTKPNDGVYPVVAEFDILSNRTSGAIGTQQVNKMVHDMLPANSVWQNYQLVGTQFIAIDVNSSSTRKYLDKKNRYPISENDPQGIGLPVFLANLVIETNHGLQHFKGQPPGTIPVNNYLGTGLSANYTNDFLRDNSNTTFNRIPYNMGGCMGCHGVAQSKGYSFSFVLLGGRDGALTDTETHFEVPPLAPVNK